MLRFDSRKACAVQPPWNGANRKWLVQETLVEAYIYKDNIKVTMDGIADPFLTDSITPPKGGPFRLSVCMICVNLRKAGNEDSSKDTTAFSSNPRRTSRSPLPSVRHQGNSMPFTIRSMNCRFTFCHRNSCPIRSRARWENPSMKPSTTRVDL